ncbi:hypothetical protein Tco_0789150 [Tanacetum coccineum]
MFLLNGVIRTKKYAELSAAEKIQADCDMKATNIILQGSPQPIINLEPPRIQETKPIFKMEGSQCNKFRGDKVKVILVKDIWLGNALSLSDQGMATWYNEKEMLAEVQEAGQISDEEKLAFLADPGVPDSQAVQKIIPNNVSFQIEDLDTRK